MSVLLVHGFLGRPEDWTPVKDVLLKKAPFLKIKTPHLWNELSPSQASSLSSAGEKLSSQTQGNDWTVVGYSLGGRILSHWPISRRSQIKKMILISAHGGLQDEKEKLERLQSDQSWAARFINEPWEKIQTEWNNQSVFAGDAVRLSRHEKDFDRVKLADALKHWSLGLQKDSFLDLKNAEFPIHYVTGERDAKFTEYAKNLKTTFQNWYFHSLPAGHSLHLSHPHEVAEMILS